jgi:hypothetical protein
MGMLHEVISLIVTRNRWLTLLSKIGLYHLLGGITCPKYRWLHFLTIKKCLLRKDITSI